jgi:hypothetical protein
MSIASSPEPPNVYLALGSIRGNTCASDAAASTVALVRAIVEFFWPASAFDVPALELAQPTTAAASTATAESLQQLAPRLLTASRPRTT